MRRRRVRIIGYSSGVLAWWVLVVYICGIGGVNGIKMHDGMYSKLCKNKSCQHVFCHYVIVFSACLKAQIDVSHTTAQSELT